MVVTKGFVLKHNHDRIVLALVGVLAIMILGLVVAEVLAATTNSQWEIGPNVSTLLATLGGTIAGAAAGYVTGSRGEPPTPVPGVVLGDTGVVTSSDAGPDDGDGAMDGHGNFDPEPDFDYDAEDHEGEYTKYGEVDLGAEPDDGSTVDVGEGSRDAK